MQVEESLLILESETNQTKAPLNLLPKSSETMISNWINNKFKKKNKNDATGAHNEDKGLFSVKLKRNILKIVKSADKIKLKNEACTTTKDQKSKSCTKIKSGSNSDRFSNGYLEVVDTYTFLSDKLKSNSRIGLRESIEIYNQIEESKMNLIEIISKYIQNESFAKDLLNILTNYTKLQIDSEARTQKLTHEMWLNQCETMRQEELEMREDLNLAIKQNCNLKAEIEALEQKNEQLCLNKFLASSRDFGNQLLETLCTNNEKLRQQVNTMSNRIKKVEREFQLLRDENQSFENKLCTSNTQLCTYKNKLQKLQFDAEVERIRLTNQLQLRENLIKETFEAGEGFFKEIADTKPLSSVLNYPKIENCEGRLPDLVYNYGRIATKIAKELSFAQTEIGLKDKEIKNLSDELEQVKESLQESKREQSRLDGILRSHDEARYEDQLRRIREECERQKSALKGATEKSAELQKKLIENEEEAFLNKEKMLEYKSENDSLRMQLHGLRQVLNASGSGDVARELADTKEKMTCFQSQYYQLLSEKNYLLQQIHAANQERESVNQSQKNYYEFIQTQQNELEKLNSNLALINNDLEQKTVKISSLQTENNKLKEDQNVMKQTYNQLKSEIKRAQKLQSEVTGVNIEANRLAIIAEYNKQLGKKLQCEVAERDEKISELESNVAQLNNAQIESSKDKVALCVELKEVCSINSELNNSLVMEQKKILDLHQSKKSLDCTTSKLKSVEDMLKLEREALKELLQDYKHIVVQRDNLVVSQNELVQQINDLGINSLQQTKTIAKINKKCLLNQGWKTKIKSLEETLKKVEGDLTQSESSRIQLQQTCEKIEGEKEELESSKAYLQNNLQKLQTDLDDTRRSCVELEKKLLKESEEFQSLKTFATKSKDMIHHLSKENSQLMQQAIQFKNECSHLQQECKDQEKMATSCQSKLQQTVAEMENLHYNYEQEKRTLRQKVIQKELELLKVGSYCNHLNEKLSQISCSAEDINLQLQSKLLSENGLQQAKLEESLTKLEKDQQKSIETIKLLESEKSQLEEQLDKFVESKETEVAGYKLDFFTFVQEETNRRKTMQNDLSALWKSFHKMETDYINKCKEYNELWGSHKDLAVKLLTAVTLLIDEKLSQQETENKIDRLSTKILFLTAENKLAENAMKTLTKELDALKRINTEANSSTGTIGQFLFDLQKTSQQTSAIEEVNEDELVDTPSVYSESPPTEVVRAIDQEQLTKKEEKIRLLSEEVKMKHQKITELQIELTHINNKLNDVKLEKCEVFLKLHGESNKLETESNKNKELVEIQSNILSQVSEMAKEGLIPETACELLINLIPKQTE